MKPDFLSGAHPAEAPPTVRVEVEGTGRVRSFAEGFTIGRDEEAGLRVDAPLVSRIHAEVVLEGGRWWLRDLGSTNGTYVEGERVERVALAPGLAVRLGQDGPVLRFSVEAEGARPSGPPAPPSSSRAPAPPSPSVARAPSEAEASGKGAPPGEGDVLPPEEGELSEEAPSVSGIIEHYFGGGSRPAGERTQMIRAAYRQVQQKQQRTYGGVILAAFVLLVAALGVVLWQRAQVARLEASTEALFYELKQQDLQVAELRRVVEESGSAALRAQLDRLEAARRRKAALYDGQIEELGLYRGLTAEEREIYRVARIFNESEFTMPAGFVREVGQVIREWQRSGRLERALRLAEERGYTPVIVRTMQHYGLPPEFFYLALQESDFDVCAVGPETRWGIAKGMWQFIPTTGRAYGLLTGPREAARVCDPLDERHDFAKATDAAARYLLYIYTELAQASGLLVMASYNWGEHRVGPNLERLPEDPLELARADLAGVPQNPQQRNYWRFLSEYRDRMPEETKGYVLHIFAAAVIGQNPRLFGFDFDNPLTPHMEAPASDHL